MNLVLKNAANQDQTYLYIGRTPDGVIYEKASTSLLGRSRVTLSLVETNKTNRVRGKLTVPHVEVLPSAGSAPQVMYTEICSFDFSVYRAGSDTGRADLCAEIASLMASPQVVDAVKDGVKPNA